MNRQDEMATLVRGISFLSRYIGNEIYSVKSNLQASVGLPAQELSIEKQYKRTLKNPYPYLLVNIGSGVSILEVFGPGENSVIVTP